jgi:hypothetical protein
MSESQIHYRADDACVASFESFVLVRCFGDVGAEAIQASWPANRAALASRPEGVISIVLVDPTTKFPSEAMRRAGVEVRKKTNANVVASITVIAGDGFWASTVRGALTAINTLAASAYPTKVFHDLREAVTWGVEHIGPPSPFRVSQILSQFEAMRPQAK